MSKQKGHEQGIENEFPETRVSGGLNNGNNGREPEFRDGGPVDAKFNPEREMEKHVQGVRQAYKHHGHGKQ